MPDLPTQKVVAALQRSNSNIEAATVELLDDVLRGDDTDQSMACPTNTVLDLSGENDLSDPEVVSAANKVPTIGFTCSPSNLFWVVGQPSQRTGPSSYSGKH